MDENIKAELMEYIPDESDCEECDLDVCASCGLIEDKLNHFVDLVLNNEIPLKKVLEGVFNFGYTEATKEHLQHEIDEKQMMLMILNGELGEDEIDELSGD